MSFLKKKSGQTADFKDLWFVFISPEDPLLRGKDVPAGARCRIMAHKVLPAFMVVADGKKIHDLDPHEILYAMAESRLTFNGPYSRENFMEILSERLTESERLKASLNTAMTIAIGALGVAALAVGGAFAYRKFFSFSR